jgi:hypothetical protein
MVDVAFGAVGTDGKLLNASTSRPGDESLEDGAGPGCCGTEGREGSSVDRGLLGGDCTGMTGRVGSSVDALRRGSLQVLLDAEVEMEDEVCATGSVGSVGRSDADVSMRSLDEAGRA